jgi:hypothetical protein
MQAIRRGMDSNAQLMLTSQQKDNSVLSNYDIRSRDLEDLTAVDLNE